MPEQGGGGAAASAGDDIESTPAPTAGPSPMPTPAPTPEEGGGGDEDLSRSELRAWAAVPTNKDAAAVVGHVINGKDSSSVAIVAAMEAVEKVREWTVSHFAKATFQSDTPNDFLDGYNIPEFARVYQVDEGIVKLTAIQVVRIEADWDLTSLLSNVVMCPEDYLDELSEEIGVSSEYRDVIVQEYEMHLRINEDRVPEDSLLSDAICEWMDGAGSTDRITIELRQGAQGATDGDDDSDVPDDSGGGAAASGQDDIGATPDAEGDSSDGSGSEDDDEDLSRSQLRAWAKSPANKTAAAALGYVINGNSSSAAIRAAMDAVQEQGD